MEIRRFRFGGDNINEKQARAMRFINLIKGCENPAVAVDTKKLEEVRS